MSSSSVIDEIVCVCRILNLVLVVVTIFTAVSIGRRRGRIPRFVSVVRVSQLRAENCLGGGAGHGGGGGKGRHVR